MVIVLPYIFQVLYGLCFTRPRYQVSVYRTIGPLVLRIYRVFVKLTNDRFVFCHSVTAVHFGNQCRVRKIPPRYHPFLKLNWDALKLRSLKHEILFLKSKINTGEIL